MAHFLVHNQNVLKTTERESVACDLPESKLKVVWEITGEITGYFAFSLFSHTEWSVNILRAAVSGCVCGINWLTIKEYNMKMYNTCTCMYSHTHTHTPKRERGKRNGEGGAGRREGRMRHLMRFNESISVCSEGWGGHDSNEGIVKFCQIQLLNSD